MTIPLPPLPEPSGTRYNSDVPRPYSDIEVRAIQREAMRVALEAAAEECEKFHALDRFTNYGKVLALAIGKLEIA